ncbi:hypothetical protein GCM10009555_035280 [Acrocarpospora macrocephala]|uniref:UDP-glucose/GDP-mannose dehydrogenase C-terminal domain-containing protein n=1 Tax=Acrocarpospora macrocephala TaxID=150177 RepID=A0A5M3WHV6_9ACTN|nr:hypothetical protein Amac_003060 [Acrocarpospora macrocephala]
MATPRTSDPATSARVNAAWYRIDSLAGRARDGHPARTRLPRETEDVARWEAAKQVRLPGDLYASLLRHNRRQFRFGLPVDAINRRRRSRTIDLVRELLGGQLDGKRIACLGAAFKPNSDDIRDAPALDVARTMHGLGANVRVYDPAALDNARRAYPELRYGTSALDVAQDADVVVLLTEWAEFREIQPSALAQVVRNRRIVDGRHALDAEAWRAEGWEYRALGRP